MVSQGYLSFAQQDNVLTWFESQDVIGAGTKDDPSSPPLTDHFYSSVLGGAKTVNHHVTQGDAEYNASKMQAFNQAKEQIDKDLQEWAPGALSANVSGMVTMPSG